MLLNGWDPPPLSAGPPFSGGGAVLPRHDGTSDQRGHPGPRRGPPPALIPQATDYPAGLLADTQGEDQQTASPHRLRTPLPSGLSSQIYRHPGGAAALQTFSSSSSPPPHVSGPRCSRHSPLGSPLPPPFWPGGRLLRGSCRPAGPSSSLPIRGCTAYAPPLHRGGLAGLPGYPLAFRSSDPPSRPIRHSK